MSTKVLIIGGGLAGLAAATALAGRGSSVTILEARNRLGGRASSFQDAASGQLVDTCQHLSMGCCTNFAHFCKTVGIDRLLHRARELYFMTPDRRITRFAADPFPAPFHLLRNFFRTHFLSWRQKLSIGRTLLQLKKADTEDDLAFCDWLEARGQSPESIARFWGLVLTSALNESPERLGLRYARKVFMDGFLRKRRGFELQLPSVPLGRLYGEELQEWLGRHGVALKLQHAARTLIVENSTVLAVELRTGERVSSDLYLAAVPFERLLDLLPEGTVNAHAQFRNLKKLETSPITSVHLWYRSPITDLPHVVLVDGIGQWVFNHASSQPGEYYLQVVVSASRQFRSLGHEEVQRLIIEEMARLFPAANASNLIRCRVVTERDATFSAVPGVDAWRSPQTSPIENLFLAGDWTLTGWPPTMEGAVRSGYLAAEAILGHVGRPAKLVQPDL